MADQPTNAVVNFVLSTLPKEYLNALTMLAGLKFPLAERESFLEQVDAASNKLKESGKATGALLKDALGNLDFPIQTPRGAMEKFYTKTTVGFIPTDIVPRFPIRIPTSYFDPGPVERPDINVEEDFMRLFGTRCGRVALEAYYAAFTGPTSEPYARIKGLRAGTMCLRG